MSCREIGEEIGISTGRVHQIWKKFQVKKDNVLITGRVDPDFEIEEIEEPVVEKKEPEKFNISKYFDMFYRTITGR